MKKPLTRRTFLKSVSLAGAGAYLAGGTNSVFGYPANEKLNIAVVGVANRGGANLNGVSGQNIVALCDVDDNYLGSAGKRFPGAAKYNDFRKMLDQKEIEAVVVSTPDHTHGVIAHAALKAGKHVYCEKPLAHSVHEVRALTSEAVKRGLATQMGTQIHAGGNYRRVVELIATGAVGPVKEVHVWCGKNWGGGERPEETPPVPANIHYDLWLGPAPYRPYHPVYLPGNWRRWWDFGGGTLGDMGCHYIDLVFWALKLRYPLRAWANGPRVHDETAPVKMSASWEFPSRGDLPPVKLTWYDGGVRPDLFTEGKLPEWGDGVLFIGEKGMLIADYGRYALLPEDRFKGLGKPDPFIPDSIGHYNEWIEACKGRGATTCSFDYSGPLTETVLLGLVAFRTGKKFEWNGKAMDAVGCPEANELIQYGFREGWAM